MTVKSNDGVAASGTSGVDDAEVRELGAALRTGVGRLYRRFRSNRAEGDLGDSAMGVLGRLEKFGPQTLKSLSDSDRVTAASMSQTVNRLTSAGLAERSRDPHDGRQVLFSVTEEGRQIAQADRARRNAWFDGVLARLDADDRAVLARAATLLQAFADS